MNGIGLASAAAPLATLPELGSIPVVRQQALQAWRLIQTASASRRATEGSPRPNRREPHPVHASRPRRRRTQRIRGFYRRLIARGKKPITASPPSCERSSSPSTRGSDQLAIPRPRSEDRHAYHPHPEVRARGRASKDAQRRVTYPACRRLTPVPWSNSTTFSGFQAKRTGSSMATSVLRRHGGAQHRVADAQRQDLLDAVVLDVVHPGLDRRAGFEVDVLRADAEGQRAAVGIAAGRAPA